MEQRACLTEVQRLQHAYVIGATGTGKSTLLLKMIKEDIERGSGVAVIDPHGDLIDAVLSHIPEKRMKDVVMVDPSDSQFPIVMNILHAHTKAEGSVSVGFGGGISPELHDLG